MSINKRKSANIVIDVPIVLPTPLNSIECDYMPISTRLLHMQHDNYPAFQIIDKANNDSEPAHTFSNPFLVPDLRM